MADGAITQTRESTAPSLAEQWRAVEDAATAIAALAGIDHAHGNDAEAFMHRYRAAPGWARLPVDNALGDTVAMMRQGLAALLAVRARGQDAAGPARALLREYEIARDAVLELLSPA